MEKQLELEIELSAGKKTFKVEQKNAVYTLIESGSIAASLKQTDGRWELVTGSYTPEDAEKVGRAIQEQTK